jgi:putative membrane protein
MITRQLTFFAPAAVMSAWAVVMLHTVVSGRINELLSPMFRDYVLVAAALLLTFSVLYLALFQPTLKTAPAFAPTGTIRQLSRWLLMLIPVIAAPILASGTMSGETMIKRIPTGTSLPMPSIDDRSKDNINGALATDPSQAVPVEVTDLIWLAQHPAQMKAFANRKVSCVGQIVPGTTTALRLMRGLMWCCAADIQPVEVDLTGNTTGKWKDDDWLEVTGTAEFPVGKDGKVTPVIKADSITPTQEPDEPYLSP